MKISLRHLEVFAQAMAKCLDGGVSPRRSLELSGLNSPSRALRRSTADAIDQLDRGATLADALATNQSLFPHFFVPAVRCGQAGGRTGKVLERTSHLCRKLRPVVTSVRNLWLYPLIVYLFGWAIRLTLFLVFLSGPDAWDFVRTSEIKYIILLFLLRPVFRFHPVKNVLDHIKLQLPLIRQALIDLSAAVYFESLNLMYKTSGLAVTEMARLAAQTIGNSVIHDDYMEAYRALSSRESFEDAFRLCTYVPDLYKNEIAVGETAGQLDRHLDKVTTLSLETLDFRLEVVHSILQRIVAWIVAVSIGMTVLAIVMSGRMRTLGLLSP